MKKRKGFGIDPKVSSNKVDIPQLIERFTDYLLSFRSTNTMKSYVQDATAYLTQIDGCLDHANKMSATHYIEYGTGVTPGEPTSRRRRKSSLVCLNNWLVDEGYIETDFAKSVKLPKLRKRLPAFLTVEEMDKLLNAALATKNSIRNRALLELMYSTGCRVQEILDMKIKDIDFEHGKARVIGKGDKERIVALSSYAIEWIKKYINDERKELWDRKGNIGKPDCGVLFLSVNLRPLTRAMIGFILKDITKLAGVDYKRVHPHLFRHTFATLMLKNGADIVTIGELLGHASIATTQIYTAVVDEDKLASFHKFFPHDRK